MTTDMVSVIAEAIGTLGFPIFVAIWLLLRTDKLLRTLSAQGIEIIALLKTLLTRQGASK